MGFFSQPLKPSASHLQLIRQAIRLAIPAVCENLFNSAIFLVDALMVASLGIVPLAAAGLVAVMMWRVISVAGCLQIGLSASAARRWGEGNIAGARRLHSHGMLLGFVIGCSLYLFLPLTNTLFRFLNAEGEVLDQACLYFIPMVLAVPLRLASINMSAIFRAVGDTRHPMMVTLAANVVNVIGNYIFIFGKFGAPELGLLGAAIGTCCAFVVEFLIYIVLSWRGIKPKGVFHERVITSVPGEEEMEIAATVYQDSEEPCGCEGRLCLTKEGFRPWIKGVTGTILRVAHPSFWEEIVISVGFLAFYGMIASFGEKTMAAHTAIIRLESFSFMAGFGVSIAAATLVGQAIGAGKPTEARRSFAHCLTISTVFMGVAGICFCLFPSFFLGWFMTSSEENFLPIALPLMILASVQQPFVGATMVMANGLRGAGMTRGPLVAQISGVLIIRVGVGYLLAFPLGLGVEGIYWGTVIDWLLRTGILAVIVLRGKWLNVSL